MSSDDTVERYFNGIAQLANAYVEAHTRPGATIDDGLPALLAAKRLNGTAGVLDVMLFCLARIAQECPDHLLDEHQRPDLDRLCPNPRLDAVGVLDSAGAAATYMGRIPTDTDIARAEEQFAAADKIRGVVQNVLALERQGSGNREASRTALHEVRDQAAVVGGIIAVTTMTLHGVYRAR